MAELTGKAVSELPAATAINDVDLLALSQGGSSKKVTTQTLLAGVRSDVNNLSGSLATFVRPNLLDNWYFLNAINQRGQDAYTSTGHAIDRWDLTAAGRFGLTNGNWRIGSSLAGTTLVQTIKSSITGPCTLSVYATFVSGTLKLRARDSGGTIIGSNVNITEPGVYSYTVASGVTITQFLLIADANNYADIAAVKLEIGSTQTLAHLEGNTWMLNEIPDYSEQLVRCQRYLFPICGVFRARATFIGANAIQFDVPCPPQFLPGTSSDVSLINSNNFTISNINSAIAQEGFTFAVLTRSANSPSFVVMATKTNHGLTDAQLYITTAVSVLVEHA